MAFSEGLDTGAAWLPLEPGHVLPWMAEAVRTVYNTLEKIVITLQGFRIDFAFYAVVFPCFVANSLL